MKLRVVVGFCLLGVLVAGLVPIRARAEAAATGFVSRDADVNGLKLHYTTGRHGPAVVLLHGFAETSRMWTPILPALGERFTVIAPDLPGIGDSGIPTNGVNMKGATISIHSLVRSLGIEKARVVGHDIGLMVAYAYAAQFPSEVEKLVVMDAFLPGVEGWEPIYNNPAIWHFPVQRAEPEALVKGRQQIYFSFFWDDLAADKTRSLPAADRQVYVAAYARPGRMRAAWAYFVSWPQAAKDFAQLAQTRLTMPVLAIGGDKSLGKELGQQMQLVATDVKVIVLTDTGHWILEERPKETTDALVNFL
jgi:pimeloyl-ACP methyl ester carboxylesterase